MKLKKIHLFLILLLTLVSSSLLGCINKEGYENNENEKFISKEQIPNGEEDLYILKSQIVPPVCPACPNVTTCPSKKECTPCPPCARCPEPAFDCKKVPNYTTNSDLPRPIVNDFSQF
tara:strand:+ start:513 stop:866 length:354 start_codon:yes stop_codon:yes gene_type:complete